MDKEGKYLLIGTILSWCVGFLGADRFYKGDIGLGVVKLITLGAFGLWWIYDAAVWTIELGKSLRS